MEFIKKITITHTAKYFISLYGGQTLQNAVEISAHKEREKEGLIIGHDEYCKIPIDIKSIAYRRGINIEDKLLSEDHEDGRFIYSEDGPKIWLNQDQVEMRKRFTFAHEIGHDLFVKDKKHQIGLLNKDEIYAENRICQMFASSLLMPLAHIKRFLLQIPNSTPWDILVCLENIARKFQVSMPALISRFGQVNSPSTFSGMFLCLKYSKNKYTKKDPCLRIQIYSPIGKTKHIRIWNNRSVSHIGLKTADNLFESWDKQSNKHRELTGGRYTINKENKLVRTDLRTFDKWGVEKIRFSVIENGHWPSKLMEVSIGNCLYAAKGWDRKMVYIISIIKM